MSAEPYRDSIVIDAPPEVVFEHFTNPPALTSWMGEGALLEPFPGGRFTVFFGQRAVEGRYLIVDPPNRLVISWGRAGDSAFGPGASRLEVTFTPAERGTRVAIVHSGLPDAELDRHHEGWQRYLPRLSAVASRAAAIPDVATMRRVPRS